ncbi:hypothetical protein [Tunturiibacter gelidoferens]|jgi:hypothetical protein|uniref:Uncharacterized protein n=1 Tax=Tunturiibacter gelidiferens TaxID=3069689 RepID=A0A9X0QHB2_9BACT|nr:hypothetical protein [Edaphobacter lichenicola]MBB5330438.1 hypothetical protein [Edaphobacter lichenicola]
MRRTEHERRLEWQNSKEGKAPAKPKKTATKTEEKSKITDPSHEQIALLAQKFWAERGWQDGYAE